MIEVRDILKTLDGCVVTVSLEFDTFGAVTRAIESNIGEMLAKIENQYEKKTSISFVFAADYGEHGNKKFMLVGVHDDQQDADLFVAIARHNYIYKKYRILTLFEDRLQFFIEYDNFKNQQDKLTSQQ